MAASVEKDMASSIEKVFGQDVGLKVCGLCKSLVAQSKDELPLIKPELEALCQYVVDREYEQKCIEMIDEALERLETESPEQICSELGLCKRTSLTGILGL